MANIVHFEHYSYVDGNVHVDLDFTPIDTKLQEAQAWLGDRVLESCRACMPLATGSLQQRSHTEDGGKTVVFPGPYARYQYGGKVMVDSVTGKGPRRIPTAPGEYILRFRKGATLIPTSRPLKYSNPAAVPEWFDIAKQRDGQAWINGATTAISEG